MEELEQQVKELSLHEDPQVQWLHSSVLGKTLKLILNDSREISGKLQCVDHLANIVLQCAVEAIPQLQITRNLGNVIVPAKGITKILIQVIT